MTLRSFVLPDESVTGLRVRIVTVTVEVIARRGVSLCKHNGHAAYLNKHQRFHVYTAFD